MKIKCNIQEILETKMLHSYSDSESGRDIPSFIEPRPPLILNPFMRPRPQKGTNLLERFEEDSECEEPELVQVYLRLKPCNTNSTLYEVRSDRCLVTSLDTTTAGHGRRTQHNVSKMYTFSHIFTSDSSQREVFENVVKGNLKKLLDGQSFTLLTYGASGSGKTYTLMGTVASPGLVPRSLEYVFNIVEAAQTPKYKPSETGADGLSDAEQSYELQWVKRLRQISAPLREKYRRMSTNLVNNLTSSNLDLTIKTKHYVWVSFIEIYNEGIYDLLVPCDRRNASKLAIREDSFGNVYVKGATQAFVRCGEEAYNVMVAGKHNLQVAATGVHAQSSRSHCIFTITMLSEREGEVRSACVRLCDLAGCERAARTRNTGARMQESRAINSSLHVLERCLHTLRQKQGGRRALVPYRESKLTRLLGAGLSGARGEAVSMVVTLNPAPEYAHETRHVLQLAAVAKDIQVNNTIAEYPTSFETTHDSTISASTEVIKLRADKERLQFELARAEACYKEQLARAEARAVGSMDTWAMVEEAKRITKEFYENSIHTLQNEKEEMSEEYENKISQLLMTIALLEENLSAEKLARARVEEEIQHLRACIEERDEKEKSVEKENNDDDIMYEDENDENDEQDPNNETLEPIFKKEDINRSKLLRKSLLEEKCNRSEKSIEINESILEKSNNTVKEHDNSDDSAVDSTFGSGNNRSEIDQEQNNLFTDSKESLDNEETEDNLNLTENLNNGNLKAISLFSRSTYSVIKDNSLYENSSIISNNNTNKLENKPLNECEVETRVRQDDCFTVLEKPTSFLSSIINSLKRPSETNNSLAQFERLEQATKIDQSQEKYVNVDVNIVKDKRNYFDDVKDNADAVDTSSEKKKSFFDNIDDNIKDKKCCHTVEANDGESNNFEPKVIKKLLGEGINKITEPVSSIRKNYFSLNRDSEDVFAIDSPVASAKVDDIATKIDDLQKSIGNVSINEDNLQNSNQNVTETSNNFAIPIDVNLKTEHSKNIDELSTELRKKPNAEFTETVIQNREDIESSMQSNNKDKLSHISTVVKENNTLDEFENIYKDITAPRATEFDLLLTQTQNETQLSSSNNETTENKEEKIYHLRNKSKTEKVKKSNKCFETEVLKSTSNCKSSAKPKKRNLRLRKRKDVDGDSWEATEEDKLKDISNLQSEFSDVTMDIPVTKKNVQDISSDRDEDNIPLSLVSQSCPSKPVMRSRRKLFTPKVEPLDASDSELPSGDGDVRVRVLRPSYHRPRARRKL